MLLCAKLIKIRAAVSCGPMPRILVARPFSVQRHILVDGIREVPRIVRASAVGKPTYEVIAVPNGICGPWRRRAARHGLAAYDSVIAAKLNGDLRLRAYVYLRCSCSVRRIGVVIAARGRDCGRYRPHFRAVDLPPDYKLLVAAVGDIRKRRVSGPRRPCGMFIAELIRPAEARRSGKKSPRPALCACRPLRRCKL